MARRSSPLNGFSLSEIQSSLAAHRQRAEAVQELLAAIERSISEAEAMVASVSGGNGGNGGARGKRRGRTPGSGRKAARAAGGAKPDRKTRRSGMGRRAQGEDLSSYIAKVLGGAKSPMGIPAIVEGVKRAGYASSSPSFARIVGMRLGDKKKFKRAGRGLYLLAK